MSHPRSILLIWFATHRWFLVRTNRLLCIMCLCVHGCPFLWFQDVTFMKTLFVCLFSMSATRRGEPEDLINSTSVTHCRFENIDQVTCLIDNAGGKRPWTRSVCALFNLRRGFSWETEISATVERYKGAINLWCASPFTATKWNF